MNFLPLTDIDYLLIERATEIIKKRYQFKKQTVGCALLTLDGKIHLGVNLKGSIGPIDDCAEQIALGSAITAGENAFQTIVAVHHSPPSAPVQEIKVVSPCGVCREFISDYAPQMQVIFPTEQGIKKAYIYELLPYKFTK